MPVVSQCRSTRPAGQRTMPVGGSGRPRSGCGLWVCAAVPTHDCMHACMYATNDEGVLRLAVVLPQLKGMHACVPTAQHARGVLHQRKPPCTWRRTAPCVCRLCVLHAPCKMCVQVGRLGVHTNTCACARDGARTYPSPPSAAPASAAAVAGPLLGPALQACRLVPSWRWCSPPPAGGPPQRPHKNLEAEAARLVCTAVCIRLAQRVHHTMHRCRRSELDGHVGFSSRNFK